MLIFKKDENVPEWIERPGDDSAPLKYLVFGTDCEVEVIDGVCNVWPIKPLLESEYIFYGEPVEEGAHIVLIGHPTHIHHVPRVQS